MINMTLQRDGLGRFAATLCMLLTSFLASGAWANEAELWAKIKSGGHLVLIRHALAPGVGDPDNFKLGDCTTQRLLSDVGREQAAQIGNRFRANGIAEADVYSSPWCRCVDTAERLKLGPVTESLRFASTFQQKMTVNPAEDVAEVKQWLADLKAEKPVVIVTHQVNISALTGKYSSSGEMVVIRLNNGEPEVVGTIETRL